MRWMRENSQCLRRGKAPDGVDKQQGGGFGPAGTPGEVVEMICVLRRQPLMLGIIGWRIALDDDLAPFHAHVRVGPEFHEEAVNVLNGGRVSRGRGVRQEGLHPGAGNAIRVRTETLGAPYGRGLLHRGRHRIVHG